KLRLMARAGDDRRDFRERQDPLERGLRRPAIVVGQEGKLASATNVIEVLLPSPDTSLIVGRKSSFLGQSAGQVAAKQRLPNDDANVVLPTEPENVLPLRTHQAEGNLEDVQLTGRNQLLRVGDVVAARQPDPAH